MLTGSKPKWQRGGYRGLHVPCHGHETPPVERERLTHPVALLELGKPVSSPHGKATREGSRWRCGYGMAEKANASR